MNTFLGGLFGLLVGLLVGVVLCILGYLAVSFVQFSFVQIDWIWVRLTMAVTTMVGLFEGLLSD